VDEGAAKANPGRLQRKPSATRGIHGKQKTKSPHSGRSGMKQRSMVGICLLLLAAVSAVVAVVAVYAYAKQGGDGIDAAYAWSAIILTAITGVWGFYFVRQPPGQASEPSANTPTMPK
jgi:hypothetical protein